MDIKVGDTVTVTSTDLIWDGECGKVTGTYEENGNLMYLVRMSKTGMVFSFWEQEIDKK